MARNKEIRKVAIVGTGVIGASWAALYLARGLDVVATDPGPNAEANLRRYVDAAWKTSRHSDSRTTHRAIVSSSLSI
jgi:3-hydroxyacyl-CoA dehydrogenase